MASIRTNDRPDGMRNDFEQSAAHLLPYDPVARKHAAGSGKRGSAEVLAVSFETTDVAAFGTKPGIGKSGVHFRYYDKSEYSKLTKEQKTELHEWRKGGAERGRSDAKTKKAKFEKAVAAAVEKKISEQVKASEEEKLAGEKLRSLVTSIVKGSRGDDNFRQTSHYHWINDCQEQIGQPNDAKVGNTDEPRGGVGQTAMGRVWSASGGGVAAPTPQRKHPSDSTFTQGHPQQGQERRQVLTGTGDGRLIHRSGWVHDIKAGERGVVGPWWRSTKNRTR